MHENYVPQEQASTQNAAATPTTSTARTGADVIAGCMSQGSVCAPAKPAAGVGTTGPQADMSYGSDAGYGM